MDLMRFMFHLHFVPWRMTRAGVLPDHTGAFAGARPRRGRLSWRLRRCMSFCIGFVMENEQTRISSLHPGVALCTQLFFTASTIKLHPSWRYASKSNSVYNSNFVEVVGNS